MADHEAPATSSPVHRRARRALAGARSCLSSPLLAPRTARRGAAGAPRTCRGAAQCAVGNLADEPKRTETTYVRAERVGGVCGARAVTGQVPGAHVGRVVATGRVVKSGT